MLVREYDMIQKLGSKVRWFCEMCPNRHKLDVPANGDEVSENRTLHKLFDAVKGLITENLTIASKLNIVIKDFNDIKSKLSQPCYLTKVVHKILNYRVQEPIRKYRLHRLMKKSISRT